jgi:glycerol dehydrogenase
MESFQDTKSVVLPRYTIGPEAYGALNSVLPPLGSRILLIGGKKALAAGLGALERALDGTGLKLAEVVTYAGHCTLKDAKALSEKARDANAQIVIGMGGGKAIDTAKACAHYAGLPAVTLPTIAATCAAVTALSVMYHEDGSFDRFLFLKSPPEHAFIHTGIIAAAPSKYLRAGMGDSIAKYFESNFSARGDELGYTDSLGLAISRTCYEPLKKIGEQALHDCDWDTDSQALRDAVQSVIVSTGLVSLLVREEYNGALAHSLYYAMEDLPQIKACLHGDVVAWGALVQMMMDGQEEEGLNVLHLLKKLKTPVTLYEMGLDTASPPFLKAVGNVPGQPDMRHLPYKVTGQMVLEAVKKLEDRYGSYGFDRGAPDCLPT